jgi:hypothetical protein
LTLEATVSMGWVNTVIAAAQRLAVTPNALLAAAGIPAKALTWERWPIDYITRLWRAAEDCTGDPGFGLKVGASVSPASINVVGFTLQSAATLREAIVLVQKYQRLISDGGRFQMLTGSTTTWLVYHPRQGELAFSPHQIEAVLSAVMSIAGWVTGKNVAPLAGTVQPSTTRPLKRLSRGICLPGRVRASLQRATRRQRRVGPPTPPSRPSISTGTRAIYRRSFGRPWHPQYFRYRCAAVALHALRPTNASTCTSRTCARRERTHIGATPCRAGTNI